MFSITVVTFKISIENPHVRSGILDLHWIRFILINKQNADGGRDIDDRTSLVGKFSSFLIDTVGSDGIGVRTGSEQPVGIGGKVDVSWKGSADGLNLYHIQFSVFWVSLINGNGIVSTVG